MELHFQSSCYSFTERERIQDLHFIFLFYFLYYLSIFLILAALGGDVGLGVSMVVHLLGTLQWGVRQSAEVENHMTSVERILEYSKLEPEVPADANLSKLKYNSFCDKSLKFLFN